MKTPLCVERDRLRERERQARAQMQSQVAEQDSPGTSGNFLFRAPIRVNPSTTDPVTQQIQSKLGDFQRVRPYLDQTASGLLIGVDLVPPSPGAPPPPSPTPRHHSLSSSGSSTNRPQRSPDDRPEFKKPHHAHPHHNAHTSSSHNNHHHQQIRGGYVKPAESKPPYGGRGGYPGQPVKHGGGGGGCTATHRSNGIQPAKGPPSLSSPTTSSSSSAVNRLHGGMISDRHARHPYEQNQGPAAGSRDVLPSATPMAADVDHILKTSELSSYDQDICSQNVPTGTSSGKQDTTRRKIETPQGPATTPTPRPSSEKRETHTSQGSASTVKKKRKHLTEIEDDAALPLEDANSQLKSISVSGTNGPNDEITAFGQSVTSQLRKLPIKYQSQCIGEIQQIMTAARTKYVNAKKTTQ